MTFKPFKWLCDESQYNRLWKHKAVFGANWLLPTQMDSMRLQATVLLDVYMTNKTLKGTAWPKPRPLSLSTVYKTITNEQWNWITSNIGPSTANAFLHKHLEYKLYYPSCLPVMSNWTPAFFSICVSAFHHLPLACVYFTMV